jgi:hypothetical protein
MEKITDKYYLGSNKSTFILYEKKISSSGKENYKNIGYLASLDAVYNTLIEKEIKEDLSLINNIEKICNMINELKEFTINYIGKDNK